MGRCPRRGFLGWVSASLSATLASCEDEPILFQKPTDVPEAIDYDQLLLEYFGETGLNDAEFIGGYYVEISHLTSREAYDSTAATRAFVDAHANIELALTGLDQRVLEDFVDLAVVDVGGWTLSRSEVDLCILAWLS
jgi:hypothetical protein